MPDREKVMHGLECCVSGTRCGDCPYAKAIDCIRYIIVGDYDKVVPKSMAEDALALLKEQEARVLTWGKVLEFIELPNEGFSEKTPCYVEVYEPDPDKIKWVDAETLHGWMRSSKMLEQRRLLYNRIGRHGWRLWTSRPSPEKMRETPWEEMR